MSENLNGTITEEAQNGDGPAVSPVYNGTAREIGRIALVNTVLGVLTFGFYRFWGKTRLRRYLWRSISFQGDAFEYTGTPKELFIGFLIALAVLVPFGILLGFLQISLATSDLAAQSIVNGITYVILTFLFQFAYYRARRFRLTRTIWRGIRAGQTGSAGKYALISFGHLVLLGLSAGLTLPLMNTTLQRFRMKNTWLGDRCFTFEGKAGKLFGRWFLTWLFLIPTLGFTYFWYKAAELRYFAICTSYEGLRLKLPVTGGQLFRIYGMYVLALIVVTVLVSVVVFGITTVFVVAFGSDSLDSLYKLGQELTPPIIAIAFLLSSGILGTVLVTHPLARLLTSNLLIIGEQDFAAIAQSSREIPDSGEGLADALDVGGF